MWGECCRGKKGAAEVCVCGLIFRCEGRCGGVGGYCLGVEGFVGGVSVEGASREWNGLLGMCGATCACMYVCVWGGGGRGDGGRFCSTPLHQNHFGGSTRSGGGEGIEKLQQFFSKLIKTIIAMLAVALKSAGDNLLIKRNKHQKSIPKLLFLSLQNEHSSFGASSYVILCY